MKKVAMSLMVILAMVGCKHNHPKPISETYTSTVILGTYLWDVETNSLKSKGSNDFWWEHVDDQKKNLVPKNGTLVAVVSKPLNRISKEFIKRYAFQGGKVAGEKLSKGTVLIFKTVEGNVGKMKVEGYKALHDFNFKEAKEYLDEDWKKFVLKKANKKAYHLVLKYKLYK